MAQDHGVSPSATALSSLRDQAPSGLAPDGLQSTDAGLKPQLYDRMTRPERAALRARYVEAQDGCCHHCKGPLNETPPPEIMSKKIDWRRFPPNFTRHPVHLHHSHKTGLTIGAVHALCNAVLWQYHGE